MLGDAAGELGAPGTPDAWRPGPRWLAAAGLPALRAGLLLDGHPGPAAAAAAALADLALLWGARALDRLATHPPDPAGRPAAIGPAAAADAAASAPVLELLLGCLPALGDAPWPGRIDASAGGADAEAGACAAPGWRAAAEAVAEGLAKLLLADARRASGSGARPGGLEPAEAARALAALLAAFHDPATEAAPAARQCLSVFFAAYAAGRRPACVASLAAAALPAARAALAAGGGPVRSPAPRVLRFVLQLLQVRAGQACPARPAHALLGRQHLHRPCLPMHPRRHNI